MLMKTDTELLNEIESLDDYSQPSLQRLSYLLRHKELWPEGFTWDFSDCSKCAMGLALAVWNLRPSEVYRGTTLLQPSNSSCSDIMQKTFNMSLQEVNKLFFGGYDKDAKKITPKIIAKRIDNYLDTMS